MNFGETLGYWYFRLNGFFLVPNLVLHQPRHEVEPDRGLPIGAPARRPRSRQNADADLLALRLPHVFEQVGGQLGDWDHWLHDWPLDFLESTVCIMCEVKTGSYDKSDVNAAFRLERLKYMVGRFGAIPREAINEAAGGLVGEPTVRVGNVVFAKVLLDDERHRPGDRAEGRLRLTPCLRLSLSDAVNFIEDRMGRYREKAAARMFFPGSLIQLLAWKSGIEVPEHDEE